MTLRWGEPGRCDPSFVGSSSIYKPTLMVKHGKCSEAMRLSFLKSQKLSVQWGKEDTHEFLSFQVKHGEIKSRLSKQVLRHASNL